MDIGLLILRTALGLLIIGHASQKVFGCFQGLGLSATADLFDQWGFRPARPMVYLSGVTEGLGGALMISGLATPLAAAILTCSLIVACAPNWAHGLWAIRGGFELALLYATIAVALGFTGSGRYSLDGLLGVPNRAWIGATAAALGLLASVPVLGRRRMLLARTVDPPKTSLTP
jgi:putative oxidoreductase